MRVTGWKKTGVCAWEGGGALDASKPLALLTFLIQFVSISRFRKKQKNKKKDASKSESQPCSLRLSAKDHRHCSPQAIIERSNDKNHAHILWCNTSGSDTYTSHTLILKKQNMVRLSHGVTRDRFCRKYGTYRKSSTYSQYKSSIELAAGTTVDGTHFSAPTPPLPRFPQSLAKTSSFSSPSPTASITRPAPRALASAAAVRTAEEFSPLPPLLPAYKHPKQISTRKGV